MDNDALQFMHKLNDGGLLYLNHYLERRCECNVFHISPSRRIIYDGQEMEKCRELKKKVCSLRMETEYFYDESDAFMVYQFTINKSRQQLVFFSVDEHQCSRILDELNRIIMPLTYFLKGLYYSFGQYRGLLQNDPERIFSSETDYWKNYMSSRMIDADSELCVVLVDPGRHINKIQDISRLVTNLCLRDGGFDIISYIHLNRIVLIVPARYRVSIHEGTGKKKTPVFPLYSHLEILEEEFGEGFIITTGEYVPAQDMFRSYSNALAARFYIDYFRKDLKLLRYKEIGAAAHVLQNLSEKTIQRLEERYSILDKYENERAGNLLSTLRELVRSQFYYQAAAQELHVHLNTLYYRQDKLSGLLGINLSDLDAKIEVYEEMFARDFREYLRSNNDTEES